jgi:hypothetical protein
MEGDCIGKMAKMAAPDGYTIISNIPGIINMRGKNSGKEQNWAYLVEDKDKNKCVLMYCAPGVFTILDENIIDTLRIINNKQISWFKLQCGYIGCHTEINGTKTNIYLHQVLMNHYRNGKGQTSIDHINRNKLDNRISNLRIVSQSEQNENRGKVRRHKDAKELPDDIKNQVLPKFVVYYKEKIKDTFREFFTVEGHPLQRLKESNKSDKSVDQLKAKRWATAKSNKVSIKDKLYMATKYVEELDKLHSDSAYTIKIPIKTKYYITTNEDIINNISPKNKIIEPDITGTDSKQDIKDIDSKQDDSIVNNYRQWKVKQIYEAIIENNENTYKIYCEEHNNTSKIKDWDMKWATFVLEVKGKSQNNAEPIIREFVEDLRRLRHNELCYDKNASVVDREGRQQWPATTIVRAFLDGKIAQFKKHTEEQTGDNPEDPAWQKRWTEFIQSLEENKENQEKLKELCSKFMTAQRTKRYRHKSN